MANEINKINTKTITKLIGAAEKIQKKDKQSKKSSYFRDKVIPALKDLKAMKETDLKNIRKSLEDTANKAKNLVSQGYNDNWIPLQQLTNSLEEELAVKYKKSIIPRLENNLKIFEGYNKVKHSLLANRKLLAEKQKLNELAIEYVCILKDKYTNMYSEVRKLEGYDSMSSRNKMKLDLNLYKLLESLEK